jgi:hypothetical protein
MSKLKEQILLGENLFVIADINHAFNSVLADFQFDIWERMAAYQASRYPNIGKPENTATKEAVSAYYKREKNSKYIGLTFPFNFMKGGVCIELNHRLYCSYYCDAKQFPEDRERLFALSREFAPSTRNSVSLFWKYPKVNVNFYNPSNEDLALLRDPAVRESIAVGLIDDAHEMWQRAHQKFF